jgi:hypothetical protein
MRYLVLGLFLLSLSTEALAACPPQQPGPINLTGGRVSICIPSTPDEPANRITASATGKSWGPDGKVIDVVNTIQVDAAPAGEIYPDGTKKTITIPSTLRDSGNITVQAHGPGGDSGVGVVLATFPSVGKPTTPTVSAD